MDEAVSLALTLAAKAPRAIALAKMAINDGINLPLEDALQLEAELFGAERGAYTGALTTRIGYLERANAGILFLDEIGNLPLNVQAKLLRAVQERCIEYLGGQRPKLQRLQSGGDVKPRKRAQLIKVPQSREGRLQHLERPGSVFAGNLRHHVLHVARKDVHARRPGRRGRSRFHGD